MSFLFILADDSDRAVSFMHCRACNDPIGSNPTGAICVQYKQYLNDERRFAHQIEIPNTEKILVAAHIHQSPLATSLRWNVLVAESAL